MNVPNLDTEVQNCA